MTELPLPVSVRWRGGRLARVDLRGREPLEVEDAHGLRVGSPAYWSPEELLIASAASSYALALATVAGGSRAALLDATVQATAQLGRRGDGRVGFDAIWINTVIETVPGDEVAAAELAAAAEAQSRVAHALAVPVHVAVRVTTVGRHETARAAA